MKAFFKNFSSLILFITFSFFTANLYGANQCSPTNHTGTLSSANPTYSNSDRVYWTRTWRGDSWNSITYYLDVTEPGSVTVTLTNLYSADAKFSASTSTCPDYLLNPSISWTQTFATAGDFNLRVEADSISWYWQNYTIDITFTPSAVPPVVTPATFSISENAQVGDTVGTVSISGNPTSVTMTGDSGKFNIDLNGVITVAALLDYETTSTYTLTVTASNAEGSSTNDVIVNIINELPPTAVDQTFYVDESAANGTLFGTIVATGNPTIYTILSGNTNSAFALDNSGNFTVNDTSVLDSSTTPQYIILVHIESPEGSTEINATVNVDATLPTTDINTRDFTNVSINGNDSISINGNLLVIGNQLLCKNSVDGGTCLEPAVGVNNNGIAQHKAKIDTSTGAPDSNTWAKLTLEDGNGDLPQADTIIFARLYWSARIIESNKIGNDQKNIARTIKIKGPNSTEYTTITSPVSRFNWYQDANYDRWGSIIGYTFDYAASQDVTAYVQANGAGNYSVGGIEATNGENTFASWTLVVIVQNPERDLNNLSVYDGFKALYNGGSYPSSVVVPASGFITPIGTEPFKASLFVYTGESESALYDTAQIEDSSGNWHNLVDGYNTINDVFNASIYTPEKGFRSSYSGEADPNFKNVIGTDIDKLEVNRKADSTKQFLDNSQTSTNIAITSNGDRYTLNMFAFETELHYPKLCYDYSYTQDGYVYTELNDGTQTPNISIPFNSGSPVNVSIYIKSLDNDVNFDHVSIYSDMNLSSVTYDGDFQRTMVNAFGYENIEIEYVSPDCLEATSTVPSCKTTSPLGNFRTAIGRPNAAGNLGYPLASAGSMAKDDFMYFKYSVLPKASGPLHTPLNLYADIQYSLATGGVPADPVTGLPFGGKRMPLCPPSTSYTPEWGIFNVIDTNLNATRTGNSGSRYLNNLLTQVVQRPFSADVVSLDPITDPPNTPKDINTSVAVELVDIKGFHDVNISCKEPAVRFSDRVYLNFQGENKKSITNLTTPFAKQDAAYRIWYIHDGNVSHIIENWVAQTDANGALTGVDNLYEQIPNADSVCWRSCGDQTVTQTRSPACYECLRTHYGYPLCSRDNFAIRPESYHYAIRDANATSSLPIVENNTNPAQTNLAAGYNYTLDVNATNHIDNNNTIGYNKQFVANDPKAYSALEWIPTGKTCNNEQNTTLPILINNGAIVNYTMSNPEVGKYSLKMHDAEWTAIDQGTPPHHINNEYWLYPQSDCNNDSFVTDISTANPYGYVGCNIDSHHTVDRSVTALPTLNYYNLTFAFKPYRLNISNITLSHGTDFNTTFPSTTPYAYVYMSDMGVESNMSLNAIGTIVAQGKNGNTLTNYTASCYADDLNISLNTIIPTDGDEDLFTTRYLDINSSSTVVTSDQNETNSSSIAPTDIFHDSDLGVASLRVHYNYTRTPSTALNPKELQLNAFSVTCVNSADCTMTADQNLNYESNRSIVINKPLDFYYGRVHSPRQRFVSPVGTLATPAKAFIYYEVYCNGTGCDKTLLQEGSSSKTSDDPRWFINSKHTSANGSASTTQQKGASLVTASDATGNAPDFTNLVYSGDKGYPYKTIIESYPSKWLIYDKYNPNPKTSEFQVEFLKGNTGWSGAHETNTTSVSGGTSITNRRVMW